MLSEGGGLRGGVGRVSFDRKDACRVWECVVSAGDVTPELPVCLPRCPTGAAVPELQLFGRFGGNTVLLATTQLLTYFDCRSFVKCVHHSNIP